MGGHSELPVVILAGGEGRRLGGAIKALIEIGGTRLIDRVVSRLAPQTASLSLCLRARADWAAKIPLDIITDWTPERGDTIGPMGGVIAALAWANARGSGHVLTVPVDCPFIPLDLVARLSAAITPATKIAVAKSDGRRHHLIAVWTAELRDKICDMVMAGKRAVHAVQENFTVAPVEWACHPDDPFFNINSDGDLTRARFIAARDRHERARE